MSDNQNNRQTSTSHRNADGSFKKGHSGNPKGKPKGSVGLSARVRRVLEQNSGKDDKTIGDVMADVLVKEAKEPSEDVAIHKGFHG